MALDPALFHVHWRPDVGLPLVALAAVYLTGWRRLRRRQRSLAPAWRLVAYLGGLATIAVALLSSLHDLAERLFAAHMVQHQLLLMVAPPALLLGNPFPYAMWGLPSRARRTLRRFLVEGRPARRVLRRLTWPPVAGLVYAVVLWGWHWPAAYEAALGAPWLHDLEHLTFFAGALLFWWPVVDPAPRTGGRRGGLYYGMRIAYLILATAQNTLLGAVLSLTERVLYPSYAHDAGLFDLTPLEDQALGGGIMWSGGHMYLVGILVVVWRALGAGESPPSARAAGVAGIPLARSGGHDAGSPSPSSPPELAGPSGAPAVR